MNKRIRIVAALLCAVLLCAARPLSARADGPTAVADEAALRAIVTQLNENGGEAVAVLESDVTMTSGVTLSHGTLTLLGGGHTLTMARNSILLRGDAVLNLGSETDTTTLRITSTDTTNCISELNGNSVLNLYDGVTLGPSTGGGTAGGVQASGQTQINMYGGTITDCHSALSVSGAVYLAENAVFTMYDGRIENCTGVQGGAVGISGAHPIGSLDGSLIYAKFHMLGGEIADCQDKYLGGGAVCIYTTYPVQFIMDGGTITGCSAANERYGYGGAVMVYTTHAEGKVELNAGEISGSSANYGGGVFIFRGTTTVADGFRLYNNTASVVGDDIYNNGAAAVTLGTPDTTCVLDGCGHTVDGWYADADPRWSCEAAQAGTVTPFTRTGEPVTDEFALKAAHGLTQTYTVVFDAGEHGSFPEGTVTEFTVPADGAHPEAPTPAADRGYVFTGWYVGTEKVTKFPETVTEDVTYVAHWALAYRPDPTEPTEPEQPEEELHYAYVVGCWDGLVHPEQNITRAEVATIFFRLLPEASRQAALSRTNAFSDVNEGDWYNVAVSTTAQLGIVKGAPDGAFHPYENITRAEFAAIAARFDTERGSADAAFSDVADHWAAGEIARAASRGWVRGYTDGTFRPDQPITRGEAMALINRVFGRTPASAADLLEGMIVWTDNADPAAWYYLDVQEATNSHACAKDESGRERWTRLLEAFDWTTLEH